MRRLWCAAAGVPLGILAAFALSGTGGSAPAIGGAAGAVLLPALVWILGRGGREPALAAPAQAGWLALPAACAAWLGLAPGAVAWLALVLIALGTALLLGRRAGRGPARAAAAFLVGGCVGVPALAGLLAARGAVQPSFGEGTAAAIYDVDARVATRPLAVCGQAPARVETLLERGAHPRLAQEGSQLWFDALAPAGDGTRQIHRLDLASGDVFCISCGEPGNNQRPAPSPAGTAVVFDTDRHADPSAPLNTEIHHLRLAAGIAPSPSRRLTVASGRDDHAVMDPGGRGVVWSHGSDGRFAVVSAGFRTGHGSLFLADPNPILPGGAGWAAPVAWSPDARSLAWVRGNPLGSMSGSRLDPATARVDDLGGGVGAGGVAYSADGGRLVVVSGGGASGAGRLPAFLGFALGALPAALQPPPPTAPTRLRTGLTRVAPLQDVDLGEAAEWGAPSGVALSPDGTWLVLGQRNAAARERLLRVTLDCAIL